MFFFLTIKGMKATKASVEFHEALPGPHAPRPLADDIQISQTETRIHKAIHASLAEVTSNLGEEGGGTK